MSFLKAPISPLWGLTQCRHVRVGWRSVTTWTPLGTAFNTRPGRKISLNFGRENVGLFAIPQLTEPTGFYLLQENAKTEAEELVQEATSPHRTRKLVKVFDQLSDCLCRVADMADFVRVAHPDQNYCRAAEEACISISALVEKLNTNIEIHRSLKKVLTDGDQVETDAVDQRVAELFMFDFEQSGIHLPDHAREAFVALNEKILLLGSLFMQGTQKGIAVQKHALPESLQNVFGYDGDNISVTGLFSDNHSDIVREAAYKIFLYPNPSQLECLEDLLQSRDELAKLVGFSTYSHRALRGTMGESPENVLAFLKTLAERIKPRVDAELKDLSEVKLRHGASSEVIHPWDTAYYSGVARHERCQMKSTDLMPYFSLGCCMEGLCHLFSSLFSVSIQNVEPGYGELWSHDVHKLAVVHETQGILGYIYCDLYERPGKPHQDCHFTIQGGRKLDSGEYQHPIVVLMLNLPPPRGRIPSCLTHSMVENLFHEFGHAMHSMLGRTQYQHVTGTRCPTDFAEVPSVLMEYFASDYRVLSKFARHWQTGEPLPYHMISSLCQAKKMFASSEMQLQVFYSILDQVYHGQHPLSSSTTDILAQVQNTYYNLPHVSGTAWQLRFGHFVGYGAKYYSYLMSRAVASQIWHQFFKDNPFNREAGERYWKEMLAHGGSKPPAQLVKDMLGTEPTVDMLVDALIDDLDD